MQDQAALIETLFGKSENYLKVTAGLYKLKAIDRSADVISSLTARLAVIVFIILFVVILNVGIALWIGKLTGDSFYGFFIVSGFYGLVAVLLHFFRNRWIKHPLRNAIVTQALK